MSGGGDASFLPRYDKKNLPGCSVADHLSGRKIPADLYFKLSKAAFGAIPRGTDLPFGLSCRRDPAGHSGRGLRARKGDCAVVPGSVRCRELLHRIAGSRPERGFHRSAAAHQAFPGDWHPHGSHQRRPLSTQRGRQDAEHPAVHPDRQDHSGCG